MTKRLLLLTFLLAQLLFSTVMAAPDGKALYNTHCAVCHNENGMGGIGLPLNGEKLDHYPRDYLFKTIRLGRKGRIMPAFEKLSDAQVNAIVDYLFSWRSHSRNVVFSKVPVKGDSENGAKLFQNKCAQCHGKDGKSQGMGTGVTSARERNFKVIPPALNNPGFLASANDEIIKYTIKNGRPGSIMPPQSITNLSDNEVNDVVSYIRSFEQSYEEEETQEQEEATLIFDSPYDLATTVENIKQGLQGMNFRYFPDRYMEMGLIDEMFVNKKQVSLRFCNFEQLYKMINIDPRLGVVLPCRITVVEHDDGQVKLYVMNMKLVSLFFNNDQLARYADEMSEVMMELIDEVTM